MSEQTGQDEGALRGEVARLRVLLYAQQQRAERLQAELDRLTAAPAVPVARPRRRLRIRGWGKKARRLAAAVLKPVLRLLRRRPPDHPLFDRVWYLKTYPDVQTSGLDAYAHYRLHGVREGRDPNPFFATTWYLERNHDVAAQAIAPIEHFYRHGAREGRDPHPNFSINRYWQRRAKAGDRSRVLGRYWEHGAP